MKNSIVLVATAALLGIACEKDDNNSNNNGGGGNNNLPSSEYYLQYEENGTDKVIRADNLWGQEDYIVSGSSDQVVKGDTTFFNYSCTFTNTTGVTELISLNLTNYYDLSFDGTDREAGAYFLTPDDLEWWNTSMGRGDGSGNAFMMAIGTGVDHNTLTGNNDDFMITITNVKKVEDGIDVVYDVKGRFECDLYETDGTLATEIRNGYFKMRVEID